MCNPSSSSRDPAHIIACWDAGGEGSGRQWVQVSCTARDGPLIPIPKGGRGERKRRSGASVNCSGRRSCGQRRLEPSQLRNRNTSGVGPARIRAYGILVCTAECTSRMSYGGGLHTGRYGARLGERTVVVVVVMVRRSWVRGERVGRVASQTSTGITVCGSTRTARRRSFLQHRRGADSTPHPTHWPRGYGVDRAQVSTCKASYLRPSCHRARVDSVRLDRLQRTTRGAL
ncbi:hypothetical protein C8R46DRAFT_1322436 [Mycena filopes]|nr:hypothetical protein C8R46DRAFT_1322436 [Mycena filopes]